MPKRKHLTDRDRENIFDAFESGVSKAKIRQDYPVTPRTLYNICNLGRSARKSYDSSNRFALKEQDKVDILQLIREDSGTKLGWIANQLSTSVSIRTIERFLQDELYICYVALRKTNLTLPDENKRVEFARNKLTWTLDQWKQTVFVDECLFKNTPHKKFIRCQQRDRLNVTHYNKRSKKRIAVNVCGFISWFQADIFQVSHHFDGTEYFDLLCNGGVLDYLKIMIPHDRDNPINYLQDNCKLHLIRPVTNLLVLHNFSLVENYPAYSPDLNAIERLWEILKKKVAIALLDEDPAHEDELFALITRCFKSIPQRTIQSLILEIPFILNEIISLNGKITKN